MSKFTFVGQSGRTSSKTTWAIEAQALVIKANMKDGLGGVKAFEAGVAEYNEGVAAGLFTGSAITLPLPKSYTNKNAGSVLYGMKDRFIKRAEKGDKATLEVAAKYGLLVQKAE